MKIRKISKPALLLLFAIVAGASLRIGFINHLSLRLDEAQCIFEAKLPVFGPGNLFHFMATDVHPPLFILILHYWINWFGTSITSLRAISLIPGVITIPVIYFLGKEIYSKKEALAASLIAAFNPMLIWYSINLKNYSFFILASALSLLFFLLNLKPG